jgi:hypothetical protein
MPTALEHVKEGRKVDNTWPELGPGNVRDSTLAHIVVVRVEWMDRKQPRLRIGSR